MPAALIKGREVPPALIKGEVPPALIKEREVPPALIKGREVPPVLIKERECPRPFEVGETGRGRPVWFPLGRGKGRGKKGK